MTSRNCLNVTLQCSWEGWTQSQQQMT
jgi:hypothetical protein